MAGGFHKTDHTADEGIRVWGKDGKELFEEAAKGMMSILVNPSLVEPAEKRNLEISADTLEDLLLLWLKEILHFFDSESMVFSEFQIEKDNLSKGNADKLKIRAFIAGEKINPLRHRICKEIKSVTRHGYYIRKGSPWWEANILFDV
ncbi:MAG TPA: archease [bacterium]